MGADRARAPRSRAAGARRDRSPARRPRPPGRVRGARRADRTARARPGAGARRGARHHRTRSHPRAGLRTGTTYPFHSGGTSWTSTPSCPTSATPPASPLRIEGATIVDTLRLNARRIPDRPAVRRRGPADEGSAWETWTWAEYVGAIREVTAGLAELGIMPGEQVGIFSNNRLEWHLADLATLANGSVTVPLYQTSSPEQVAYVLGHAEARAVLRREPRARWRRILEVRDELPKLDRVDRLRERRPARRPVRRRLRRSSARSARPGSSANPTCSTSARTRSNRSSWPRSSTRAARPARPRGR